MRFLILAVSLLFLVCIVSADDLGNRFIKISIPSDPGIPDGREGGETVDDANIIPAIPFSDTGNTSDNVNDYDEVCPYTGSLSPDVVYSFTPDSDLSIDIDLCDSGYDTKVYVYENTVTHGNPYACNDDADCALAYRSALYLLSVVGGNTYYIVIDGYGSEEGDYILSVSESPPPPILCELECPPAGVAEGEPPLVEDYIDVYNGGCNSSPYVFQTIDFPILCGKSGWYVAQGQNERDTDWFSLIGDMSGYNSALCYTEFDVSMFILLPLDCNSVGVAYDALCECETPGYIEFSHPANTEYWLWVGPPEFTGPVNEFNYILDFDNDPPSPVQDVSWGKIKTMFN
jgi:hypothetical protein